MEGEGRPLQRSTVLKIWTDGALRGWSKRKVIGMAAVTCYRGKGRTNTPEVRSWRVESKKTSSMHAELFAIQCALEAVPKEQKSSCHIIVVSDCLDAVQAVRGNKIKPRYLGLVKHIRDLLQSFPKARIVWCKSHSGHRWNELANEVAQKAAGTWNPKARVGTLRGGVKYARNERPR